MAKPTPYRVTLFPAERGPRSGMYIVRFLLTEKLPARDITATSVEDAVAQARAFATESGKCCRPSIKCLAPRKPAGFDAKTRVQWFFDPADQAEKVA